LIFSDLLFTNFVPHSALKYRHKPNAFKFFLKVKVDETGKCEGELVKIFFLLMQF